VQPLLDWISANYQWKASLAMALAYVVLSILGMRFLRLIPVFRQSFDQNAESFKMKMKKESYAKKQKFNQRLSLIGVLFAITSVFPFCLTEKTPEIWCIVIDITVILMVYDFLYYFLHRFIFHDNGFIGGPLRSIHAVHHRQHVPCTKDSTYLHPIELVLGLGLFLIVVLIMAQIMGPFSVASLTVAFMIYGAVNNHNHALWDTDRFPFRYFAFLSRMHHYHHAKFTGGNYATITPMFDWMFGSLDHGSGWKKRPTNRN
jgi:sterol desaturase/sphingolipid hydroxylase (fatty acid hydroxylase superfamily)